MWIVHQRNLLINLEGGVAISSGISVCAFILKTYKIRVYRFRAKVKKYCLFCDYFLQSIIMLT